jgi:hypothetical protein
MACFENWGENTLLRGDALFSGRGHPKDRLPTIIIITGLKKRSRVLRCPICALRKFNSGPGSADSKEGENK